MMNNFQLCGISKVFLLILECPYCGFGAEVRDVRINLITARKRH